LEIQAKLTRLIERIRLFHGFKPNEISFLLKKARPKRLDDGQVLICAGSPPSSLYVILSGAMVVTSGAGERHEVLATLEPGSTVGEMSLVDNSPRSARVVAEGETTVFEFDQYFLDDAPKGVALKVYQNLSRILAQRVRESNQLMDSTSSWPDGPEELSTVLKDTGLSHMNLEGVDLQGSILIGADFTGADLRGANFQGANLGDVNLTNARIKERDLLVASRDPVVSDKAKAEDDDSTAESWARLQKVMHKKKAQKRR
jgi:CRP-like cAMP-binding protein